MDIICDNEMYPLFVHEEWKEGLFYYYFISSELRISKKQQYNYFYVSCSGKCGKRRRVYKINNEINIVSVNDKKHKRMQSNSF